MQIKDLPYSKERAVIVNVNTLLCTTLAILSAKRYLDMPLLVIDCPLNGKSDYNQLLKLQKYCDFELLPQPLLPHGSTLDKVFTCLQSDFICLVDSDLEILTDRAIALMREMMHHSMIPVEQTFGSGMIQVSGFGLPPLERWFHKERMWIPLTYLNRRLVAEEIARGTSFNIDSMSNYNGTVLPKLRNKCNKLNIRLIGGGIDRLMNLYRKEYKKQRIDLLHYDTGALIYENLRKQGKHFIGWSFYDYPNYCTHYCGVTRARMYDNEPVATNIGNIETYIHKRLLTDYNIDFKQFYGIK